MTAQNTPSILDGVPEDRQLLNLVAILVGQDHPPELYHHAMAEWPQVFARAAEKDPIEAGSWAMRAVSYDLQHKEGGAAFCLEAVRSAIPYIEELEKEHPVDALYEARSGLFHTKGDLETSRKLAQIIFSASYKTEDEENIYRTIYTVRDAARAVKDDPEYLMVLANRYEELFDRVAEKNPVEAVEKAMHELSRTMFDMAEPVRPTILNFVSKNMDKVEEADPALAIVIAGSAIRLAHDELYLRSAFRQRWKRGVENIMEDNPVLACEEMVELATSAEADDVSVQTASKMWYGAVTETFNRKPRDGIAMTVQAINDTQLDLDMTKDMKDKDQEILAKEAITTDFQKKARKLCTSFVINFMGYHRSEAYDTAMEEYTLKNGGDPYALIRGRKKIFVLWRDVACNSYLKWFSENHRPEPKDGAISKYVALRIG